MNLHEGSETERKQQAVWSGRLLYRASWDIATLKQGTLHDYVTALDTASETRRILASDADPNASRSIEYPQ